MFGVYKTKKSFQEFSKQLNQQTENYVRERQLLELEMELNRLLNFFN